MRTELSALADLAGQLRATDLTDWTAVSGRFTQWASRPGLRDELRHHLQTLSGEVAAAVISRSRETTTHFAWCLLNQPGDKFSFWLHEYKPQRDWRIGYADSVHNHRYHFCTTLLRGCYVHERFDADLDPNGLVVKSATMVHSGVCEAGESGTMLSDQFHRIPKAADGTMTFLVKSRPVRGWSLSFDPATSVSRRHVPVEERLGNLADRL
ncbi:hypothetical protein LWC34_48910 [Kibdelosporangium philippinense]|uniref:Uncharacterized protein n=1 Tax=Kibdelosporangium philippinense TaxID=211113 RepID=A0ABS8ZSW1_9PSEU|nr:hypothetical protein [Kibdelosporangium philippinense]MCE7010674.1 hypothetical protein [Kibdelosporangium philippinense]